MTNTIRCLVNYYFPLSPLKGNPYFVWGVTCDQFNELWQSRHFVSNCSAVGQDYIKEILLREGSLGKTFLFHNERSTAFSSLPACTMTSEDVMSGAIAAP